ncbi:MAG: SUMF1/EgtB/PvdO family nonheme iron enzyme [Thiogranum sp.]|nr:SUMF1/EgtB/PvdO family nonheme iron enzyme [Thiogranum sp.]
MGAAKKLIDKKLLRDLIPLNALSAVHLEEISRKAVITETRAGRYVFKKGDRDYQSVYLLDGKIQLLDDSRTVISEISAGSEVARHPLAHKQPRQLSARAVGSVTVACIDSNLLDVLLTWDESSGYDVVEIDAQDDDDWMTRMLQSQAFLQLPPSNIHQLLMRLETIQASAGDSIVRQGDDGDYFYIVKSGRLSVTRRASSRSKDVALAELGEGTCFGEEALVSGTKRNASVTMLTDGCLMRLAQADFNELLRTPLVHEIDLPGAQQLIAEGAKWLDVRLPGELGSHVIKGAINLPLSALRDQAADLDDSVAYIVCCDTGRRSAAGAFVLSQNGFSVYTLKNGLKDVPDDMLTQARAAASDEPVRDAEVVQIEPNAGDAAVIPIVTSEAGSPQLSGQLEAVQRELADAKTELAGIAAIQAGEQSALDQARRQNKVLEEEAERVRRERDDLEAALMKNLEASQSSQGKQDQIIGSLEKQQQDANKRIQELEKEIERITTDYKQLGQRASALGGERDAARKEIDSLQAQLDSRTAESADHSGELKNRLARAEKDLEAISADARRAEEQRLLEQEQRIALESEYAELQQNFQKQEEALQNAVRQATTEQKDLQDKLAQAEKDLDALSAEPRAADEQRLQEQEQSVALERKYAELQQDFQKQQEAVQDVARQAEQAAAELAERARDIDALGQRAAEAEQREQILREQLQSAAKTEEELLLQFNADAAEFQNTLNQRIEELQAEVSARDQQLMDQESQRDDLANKLTDAEQALEALSAGEREARESLAQAQAAVETVRAELVSEVQQSDELRQQLESSATQIQSSDKQRVELESRIKALASEHESDIASLRGALSRAQDESENVKREQTRLMEALRKAEANLVTIQNGHDEELHRLRKELKENAGQSNAGLAAELDAVQAQLKEGRRVREDLELQLGSRSEQLETVRAEQEKTIRRLEQAQESARQAEQQLIEANQAASEEMAVRLDAEQAAQDCLREERDRIAAEYSEEKKRCAAFTDELGQLQRELQRVRAEQAEQVDLREQLDTLTQALDQVRSERDQALEQREQMQEHADRLRAEAEITRGLGEIGSENTADDVLREQVIESRRYDEVAVESKVEAESQVSILRQEVERLEAELDRLRSDAPVATLPEKIPQLPGDDAEGAAFLESVLKYQDDESISDDTDSPIEQRRSVESVSSFVSGMAERPDTSRKPIWGRLAAVVAACGVVGAAAFFWFQHQPFGQPDVANEQPIDQQAAMAAPPAVAVTADVAPRPDPVAPPVAPAEPKSPAAFRDRLRAGGQGPEMVSLPAASFDMGSGSMSLNFDERPRHEVHLQAFSISRHETTFDEYEQFRKSTGRARPADSGWGRGKRPVINVSWVDAVAYARWLSEQTGHTYRLPSEAEWEFVARAGSLSRFSWGNEVGTGKANCFDCGSEQGGRLTAPVGTFEANSFGVHEMAGNVREWVQDCTTKNYNDAATDGSAVEVEGCSTRVVRGGSFGSPSNKLRTSARDNADASARSNDLGFRVVRVD